MVMLSTFAFGSIGPASGDDGRHPVQFTLTNAVTQANSGQALPGDFSRCHFSATGAFDFDPRVVPIIAAAGFDGTITGDV